MTWSKFRVSVCYIVRYDKGDLDDEIANQESNFRYAAVNEPVGSCADIFDSRDKRDPLCRLNDATRDVRLRTRDSGTRNKSRTLADGRGAKEMARRIASYRSMPLCGKLEMSNTGGVFEAR